MHLLAPVSMIPKKTALILALFPSLAQAGDPTDIPGNVVWLDASDPDGDGVSGGGFVNGVTWVDKSTSGLASASQIQAMRRPQIVPGAWNGLSALRFDGNDFMDVDASSFGMLNGVQGATMVAVASTIATSNQRVFMVSTGANSAATRAGVNLFDSFGTSIGGLGDYGAAGRRLDSNPFQRIEGGNINMGELGQYAAIFDFSAGQLELFVEGDLVTSANNFQSPGSVSPTDSVNIRVGADANLNQVQGTLRGDLAEVLVYDRVLTELELQSLVDYLHVKWFASPVGDNYCGPAVLNSSGSAGALMGFGSTVAMDNDLTLVASNLPVQEFGYFLTSMDMGFVAAPMGSQGNLCLGGTIGRYVADVASSGPAGKLLSSLDLMDMPAPVQMMVGPGETWYFQCWHRDQNPGPTSNFTEGLRVVF